MINEEKLKKAGIDYKAGLERFLNDSEFYAAVLEAYLRDSVLERADKAYDSGDAETLLAAVHEAKGSSGNVGLTDVFEKSSSLVTLLRSKDYTKEELQSAYRDFKQAYTAARDGIQSALE